MQRKSKTLISRKSSRYLGAKAERLLSKPWNSDANGKHVFHYVLYMEVTKVRSPHYTVTRFPSEDAKHSQQILQSVWYMVHISQCKLVTLQTVYLTASPGAFDSEKRLQSEWGSFRLNKLSLPSWRLSSGPALSPLISASRQLYDESRVVSLWQGHKTSALNLSLVKEYLNWQPLSNITTVSYLVGRGDSMVTNDQYRL